MLSPRSQALHPDWETLARPKTKAWECRALVWFRVLPKSSSRRPNYCLCWHGLLDQQRLQVLSCLLGPGEIRQLCSRRRQACCLWDLVAS